MNRLQLANLSSNSQLDVLNRERQKNVRGGDRFNDGELGSSEKQFISIVTRAIETKPEVFGPKFSDPGWNQEIQDKYPDIYNALVPS